ncbi:methyltransferase domain-containing protein [Candidatus Falkowbacteria bacterium]|nr:methyltransferase domain-containing protein [Candidatus Falkowbacteria bacterium]
MNKLNLGCGKIKKEGYINLDWDETAKPDIKHDLNKVPYPFWSASFDLIEASHVIEHLDRPLEVMKELHRLLSPEGKLIIKVPHFSRGFAHPEHTHGFDVILPHFFRKDFTGSGYVGVEFDLEKLELHWFPFFRHLPYLGYGKITISIMKFCNVVFSYLANLSPNFCSRIWCYWVGGFDEIEFHFRCKK